MVTLFRPRWSGHSLRQGNIARALVSLERMKSGGLAQSGQMLIASGTRSPSDPEERTGVRTGSGSDRIKVSSGVWLLPSLPLRVLTRLRSYGTLKKPPDANFALRNYFELCSRMIS